MSGFIQKYLYLNSKDASSKAILTYISIAYLFSLAIRFILFFQTQSIESFWLNGDPLPIWSPDAGLYGYYAKQLLAGHSYPYVAEYMPGHLVAFITSAFNLNIDWVMFLLPAFLSSLVVVPIVLMGHALKLVQVGFFAALIGSIGINFYTRSHLGYMDTDTLNLFFPYMAIASMMLTLQQRSYIWGAVFIASLVGFHFWYHSSLIIIASIAAMTLVVTPIVFKKRLALIGSVLIIIAALFSVDVSKIVNRAGQYVNSDTVVTLKGTEQTYHFNNTLGTVSEAIDASLFEISPMFVGTEFYVTLALLGYVLLIISRPIFLMALPMVALGIAASELGMRFTMFATPILAFGFVFLFNLIQNHFPNKKLPLLATIIGVGLMLYNILIVNASTGPYFFKKEEVKTLKEFATLNKQKDLIYSWWDYGWPLWYYIGANNTLIDNGRHGSDSYLVSKLLLSHNPNFVYNAMKYFSQQKYSSYVLKNTMKTKNLNDIFQTLNYDSMTDAKRREAYIMLHRDMLLTFRTLENFANTDLSTGNTGGNSELYISNLLKPYSPKEPIIHGDTFKFDLRDGNIIGNDGAKAQINGIIISQNGKIAAAKQYNKNSSHILIIYNNQKAIYLDKKAFGTFLVQVLLLDRYDKGLFEKVAETESFKVLKLR
ncbi:MAG: STT3 domain-containing protein [Campylobacterota bacterium]|nr:STT3 domain-containing protein [Campylobacterota bacterium]